MFIIIYHPAVRSEEATEPPGTSEKSDLEALVRQKQAQVDTNSKDDHQHAKLSLPSPGLNCDCDLCNS